jgi:hypothetical protein
MDPIDCIPRKTVSDHLRPESPPVVLGRLPEKFWTPAELVEECRRRKVVISRGTLRNWRSSGSGPKYHRIAGRIYYDWRDAEEWLANSRFGENHQRCPRPLTPSAPADSIAAREARTA